MSGDYIPEFAGVDLAPANWSQESQLDTQQMVVDAQLANATFNYRTAMLRQQMPGLAIAPFPNATTVVSFQAPGSQDIAKPSGAKLAKFRDNGSGALFMVSRNGNAIVPNATVAINDRTTGSFFPDPNTYYYVGELSSISVSSNTANSIASVEWYFQQ